MNSRHTILFVPLLSARHFKFAMSEKTAAVPMQTSFANAKEGPGIQATQKKDNRKLAACK
jgi:hypothetical protein